MMFKTLALFALGARHPHGAGFGIRSAFSIWLEGGHSSHDMFSGSNSSLFNDTLI
jgi:hypothetical protein